jgi:triacylglycerol lipase
MRRLHIVLVPGFAGFDALGQLEYYAGITPLFQKRHARNEVLPYFDNFPTAAVATRAERLRAYLAKRIARGEISASDDLILVGHSTGGLDIRSLLWTLHRRKQAIVVDGGAKVRPKEILERLRRVVFLSVPHWGTNIADWVRAHPIWREALVAELRAAVASSQVMILERIEDWIADDTALLTGAGLIRAAQDALAEANENNGNPCPLRSAEAHEAASLLALYLRQMASDFHAIDDLTSQPPNGSPDSPAHFAAEREEELKLWRRLHIEARSYATLGSWPFRFDPGHAAPSWNLTQPWTYPEFTGDTAPNEGTDIVYRTCYRACAGGPFQRPAHCGKVTRRLPGAPDRAIELWDNDGIVNTASMLWPTGENVLVPADHMDIVGHYEPVEAIGGCGRHYRTYDLLKSNSGFDSEMFQTVWSEIFAFCRTG